MHSRLRTLIIPVLSLNAGPVFAEELRDFCSDRPGLGTPACIMDKGHFDVEVGIADWTRDSEAGLQTDAVNFGELLIRYGLTSTLEAQVGWDGYGLLRTRDRKIGVTTRDDGAGDMSFALRQSLQNPDGSGLSIAVMPYITAPTGAEGLSAGDWGAGLIVPIAKDLGKGWSIALTPEIDAAVDGDGEGRHLAFGSVVGVGYSLAKNVSMTVETSLFRDQDPEGHTTVALAGLAFAWQPMDNLQLDVGVVKGLNSDSPDTELYFGTSRRF